ncbi:DUF3048 domain-containing protein [Streptomyces sp. ISL-98]|uniref:DUF3048 domain-containing protein n=1 Tax=Streptomyces sp. ISL-98 TaxID=2819192 RepID=UPI001BEBE7F1|nr:DUF3048 domain-containing protein [Streptomyces sp. ISL-98]MBT2508896.1 DUF3048 domain-containing protein [Streptomyces sp. ISL-98]
MHATGVKRTAAVSVATLALLVLAACGDGSGQGGGTSPPPDNRVPSTEKPAPVPDDARILAVKIDNVRAARPPTGLDRADIVYVEQVESGLSRILAAYSSDVPSVIGPVRSARESDLELLRQFNRPTLAYSGAQSRLIPLIEAAPLDALPPSKAPRAYFRGGDRPAPHNLYLRPGDTPYDSSGVNAAESIGLRFAAPPAGGKVVKERTVRYPAARFTFTWSADQQRWLVAMDGSPARTADGKRLSAANVVVQDVTVRPSAFRDRSGSPSPFTETVGSGSATVLRGGRAYNAEWGRDKAESRTVFTTPDGKRMTFASGQIWIVYAAR